MVSIGFTGSRELHPAALEKVETILYELCLEFSKPTIITGACIGIDALVANVACSLLLPVHTIVPWKKEYVDPFWEVAATSFELMKEGTTYRERNEKIVSCSEMLYAFPKAPETTRSGTWMTVRIARKKKIPVILIPLYETQSQILQATTQRRQELIQQLKRECQ